MVALAGLPGCLGLAAFVDAQSAVGTPGIALALMIRAVVHALGRQKDGL